MIIIVMPWNSAHWYTCKKYAGFRGLWAIRICDANLPLNWLEAQSSTTSHSPASRLKIVKIIEAVSLAFDAVEVWEWG